MSDFRQSNHVITDEQGVTIGGIYDCLLPKDHVAISIGQDQVVIPHWALARAIHLLTEMHQLIQQEGGSDDH